jgi:hypothetical protein
MPKMTDRMSIDFTVSLGLNVGDGTRRTAGDLTAGTGAPVAPGGAADVSRSLQAARWRPALLNHRARLG